MQNNENLHSKNNKVVECCNENFKNYKKYSNLNNNDIIKNNKNVLKNKCIKNTLIYQTKINNKFNLELSNKINLVDKNKLTNITKEKDTLKNNVLLAKLCEQKVVEKSGLKLSEEYIKMNNKIISENFNKAKSVKLNNKQTGSRSGVLQRIDNFRKDTSKSIPKNITTAIICMWLFVFCACLALVAGVGYSYTKNNNLQVLPNTTTAEGSTFSGGDGTESNPYQIATYADLQTLASNCNGDGTNAGEHYENTYFKVTNDITIDASTWDPIAYDLNLESENSSLPSTLVYRNYFSGVFDGSNKKITISGTITKTFTVEDDDEARTGFFGGFFGCIKNGGIKNVNIEFTSISTSDLTFDLTTTCPSDGMVSRFYVGGVVGLLINSTMSTCNLEGDTIKPQGIAIQFGGFVGKGEDATINNCVLNADILIEGLSGYSAWQLSRCYAAGIVALTDGTVSNCKIFSNLQFSGLGSRGGDGNYGTIAGSAETVDGCEFRGNIFYVNSGSGFDNVGGIVGSATIVKNCKFISTANSSEVSITLSASGDYPHYVGGIVGSATLVENCCICANFNKLYAYSRDMGGVYVGFIAGQATTIKNCFADASVENLNSEGDSFGYTGTIAGQATTIQDCGANISVGTITTKSSGYFGFITGNATTATDANGDTINPSIKNCLIVADVESASGNYLYSLTSVNSSVELDAYNCVVVGSTSGLTNSDASTNDSTNGLYVLTSDDAKVDELKKSETYLGTGTDDFTWNTTEGNEWGFDDSWVMINDGEDFPTLQITLPSDISITLNITTNLNSVSPNQFIIYKFDDGGNITNQFVVTNGSEVIFETTYNQKFTILINHKLYMVTTIDGESAVQKSYTPTEDTTINITITAPSGVNNWVVI